MPDLIHRSIDLQQQMKQIAEVLASCARITVSATAPENPQVNDIWIDIS